MLGERPCSPRPPPLVRFADKALCAFPEGGLSVILVLTDRLVTDVPVRLGAGGGLTREGAVGLRPDLEAFCRPPPSEERQRDLIGAWRRRPH